MSANKWNLQYTQGAWSHLRDREEVAHYAVIAALIRHFEISNSVLDIGCGEGLLQSYLLPFGYSRYVGLDISEVAIQKANTRKNDHTEFIVADASTFVPKQLFSAVAFSECLYYFADPFGLIHKYMSALEDHGMVLISIYVVPATRKLIREISGRFRVIDETLVSNVRGTWKCIVLPKTLS
jgi:trans-aconitate methyltransferase